MLEKTVAGAQLWFCRKVVGNFTAVTPGASVIHIPDLAPGLSRELGIVGQGPEELLSVVLEQWTVWGFARRTGFPDSYRLTADGIAFAHQQVILEELRRIRVAEPSLRLA